MWSDYGFRSIYKFITSNNQALYQALTDLCLCSCRHFGENIFKIDNRSTEACICSWFTTKANLNYMYPAPSSLFFLAGCPLQVPSPQPLMMQSYLYSQVREGLLYILRSERACCYSLNFKNLPTGGWLFYLLEHLTLCLVVPSVQVCFKDWQSWDAGPKLEDLVTA